MLPQEAFAEHFGRSRRRGEREWAAPFGEVRC